MLLLQEWLAGKEVQNIRCVPWRTLCEQVRIAPRLIKNGQKPEEIMV